MILQFFHLKYMIFHAKYMIFTRKKAGCPRSEFQCLLMLDHEQDFDRVALLDLHRVMNTLII